MTPTPAKRPVGRPRKAAKPENPDIAATKGFVKCLVRKYHEQQTVKNVEFRKQCCVIDTIVWVVITFGIGCAYVFTGVEGAAFLAVVSGFFVINSIMKHAHLEDATRYSEKHTDFMQKYQPPCESESGCDEG